MSATESWWSEVIIAKGYSCYRSMLKWGVVLSMVLSLFSPPLLADYAVQVGVYNKRFYADELLKALRQSGFPVEGQLLNRADGTVRIRVIVGPYPQRESAIESLIRLKAAGYDGFVRSYSGAAAAVYPFEAPQTEVATPVPPREILSPSAMKETADLTQRIPQPSEAERPAAVPDAVPPGTNDIFSIGEIEEGESSAHFMGFFQSALAYTKSAPEHLSKFRNTLELAAQGRFTGDVAWKVSGRVAYDAVFDLNDYYPTAVRDDQQLEKSVRETYLDVSAGNWDYRLGRQQIIWGEMVGLFFADVISAKDLREFVLPDFDFLRIPQWAVRSEYFKGDFHGEAIWIPYPTYDNIGVPGSEFYPYPMPPPSGYGAVFAGERHPAGSLSDSNYGLRLSYLLGGWDVSGFYYNSMDASPTFFRTIVAAPTPTFVYTPDHTRIQQIGGTFSKDLNGALFKGGELGEELIGAVLKGEMVYTQDRYYEVNRLSDANGAVRQDTLDYILGLDYSLPQSSRLDFQFFQRWYPNHDPDIIPKRIESGASIYLSTQVSDSLEAELLWIEGLNRHDWMARPKLKWNLSSQWRWIVGADFFNGVSDGLFGRFADKDRVYTEVRFTF
jgi:hypothetical protein